MAESNVEELKEKLRVVIKESKAPIIQIEPKDEYKLKYKELVKLVLSLSIATDPLASILSLHESYIDDFEQAKKHLESQVQLVETHISSIIKDKDQNLEKLSREHAAEIIKIQSPIREKDRQVEIARIEVQALQETCERQVKQQKEVE